MGAANPITAEMHSKIAFWEKRDGQKQSVCQYSHFNAFMHPFKPARMAEAN